MAYRGGGRGRGRGRGGYENLEPAKAEPFVIFPEITLPDPKSISSDSKLLSSYFSFQKFWRNSPYHLGDGLSKQESESLDIERFSDSLKPKKKTNRSASFYDFLVLKPDNFPKELLGDTRRERPVKRAKWTQDADLQKLDVFEKLEAKYKAEGTKRMLKARKRMLKARKRMLKARKRMKKEKMMKKLRNQREKSLITEIMIRIKTLMMTTTTITRRLVFMNKCIKLLLLPKRIKFCIQEKPGMFRAFVLETSQR